MKTIKSILGAICLSGGILGASTGWSYTIGSVDVGDVDQYLSSTYFSSYSISHELSWIRKVLRNNRIGFQESNATYRGTNWLRSDEDSRVYGFDLGDTDTEYFVVRTRGGSQYGPNHFLFQNIAGFSWAVVDLDLNGIDSIERLGKLEQIREYAVPEPTTALLFGMGLLGLAGSRKLKSAGR